MPILIAIIGALGAAAYWYFRMRDIGVAGRDLVNVANDVRLAARRFGFKRNANVHPAESIEDPKVAIGALAVAFLELDDLPSQEARIAMTRELQQATNVTLEDAEELAILGRWMMSECGGPEQTVTRLSKKLYKLGGSEHLAPLMQVLNAIGTSGNGTLSERQRSALDDIKYAFKL
ncbi:hypothetical protein BDE40_0518 [Litoreibacter halocynthiae]|uniref:Tellurite resistance protein TerB n=1 Tax=Litoreibacter halocynthiae TaxID=1242689 RepID=A0A4R7LMK7_9RHOB|nr:hypothetical protein [Litoreibacter halocynthiae]TDT77238.1 hypothetical protein BDE40_0518 [Litoreibacter halocynthiae]